MPENIGNYSIVAEDVVIGKGSRVWHHCNLYGCCIGENTQIGSYTEVKKGAKIGNDCRFQSYVFVPEGTTIGNDVFVGPNVVFLNDKMPTAKKARSGEWKLEAVVVEDGVTLGGRVTVNPGVRIGRDSFIGAGTLVTKDVPAGSVVVGHPGRIIGSVYESPYREKIGGYRNENPVQ